MKRTWCAGVACCALVVGGIPRDAAADISTGSWYMNQSNTLADGVNYGQVSIEADSTAGTVKFTVDAFDVQPEYGTLEKFGMDQFGFSFENVTSAPNTWTLALPSNWSQNSSGGNLDGFGSFMVHENTAGANNRLPQLVFTITLPTASEAIASNFAVSSSGVAGQGNVFFAAHVAGFSNAVATSHFIGGSEVVPAPGAVMLGAIGLFLTFVSRTRRHIA